MSGPVSFLAVVFASASAGEDAMAEFQDLAAHDQEHGQSQKLELRDCAIVSRDDRGRIDLEQSRGMAAGEGLVSGGTAGLVAGLLLGLPIGGALLGLAGGAALGLRDRGIPDSRMRRLGEDLEPGQAILCVLVGAEAVPRARAALSRYGEVLEVEVSPDPDR